MLSGQTHLRKTIEGLHKTSNAITNALSFKTNYLNLDDYESIERILIESDMGFQFHSSEILAELYI